MKSLLRIFVILILLLGGNKIQSQTLTYSETFQGGSPATIAQADGWYNFVASLVPLPYNRLTFSGGPSNMVFTCTDPAIIADIALSLRTSVTKSWVDGANTWRTGPSGSGGTILTPCYELSVNVTAHNACTTPGHTIRPCIGNSNSNWGGMGTTTCGAPTQTLTVEFFAGTPCDTTLEKSVILGPGQACTGRPFNLIVGFLQGNTQMVGATHQWQYSDDGMTWVNYTGPVNSAAGGLITDVISEPRWYRCAVTCVATGLTYTTPVHKVDIAPFYYCYCINSVRDKEGNDIGNVTIMSSNKLDTVFNKALLTTGTGLPVYENSGANRMHTSYQDSLAAPCLSRDSTYIFHVSQIFSGKLYEHGFIHGFIDFDRDGVYHKTNERVFVKKYDPTAVKPEIVQVAVTVPKDTNFSKLGITGMRLVLSRDSVYVPCDSLDGRGEVEDYLVKICPPPCTGPVDGGIVVSTDSSMCKGYEYTVTDTTYSQNQSAFDRSWQMSGDNINWLNVANSDNKDTLNRTFTGQRIYYRLRTICLPTHDTNYSPSTMVNEKAKFKCYCYSRATGGFGVDTSDIGAFAIADYSNNAGGPHLLNERARKPRTDYTEQDPIELFTDSIYKFNVFHSMPVAEHGDAKVTVFIDFNNNHAYDIPQERVYSGFTSIGHHTIIDNVFIPLQAITDMPTGMRVILNNNLGPNVPSDEACGGYLSGETEDYMVILRKKWRAGISGMETEVNGFNVHPNPASGRFWVQFSSGAITGDIKVRVTNVTGQLVQEESYKHEGGMFYHEVDMSGQANGVYFVELQAGDKKMISKLVLQ